MGVACGNFDGDSFVDCYVGVNGTDQIAFGSDSSVVDFRSHVDWDTRSVTAVDLSGDGRLDIVITTASGEDNQVLSWPTTRDAPVVETLDTEESTGVAFGLVDADTDVDLILINNGPGGHKLFSNTGAGSFVDSGHEFGAPSAGRAGVLADFDEDGDPDLFVANEGRANELFTNAAGMFSLERTVGLFVRDSRDVAVADFDEDGHLDIVVVNFDDYNQILYGRGDGTFLGGPEFGDGTRSVEVIVGDFDGDSHVDIFVANSVDPDELYINIDGGVQDFPFSDIFSPSTSTSVSAALLDGDTELDVFVGTSNGNNMVYSGSYLSSAVGPDGVGPRTSTVPIPFIATFSKPVADFESTGIVFKGGTVSNFAGSGTAYTFDVTPEGEGAQVVSVAEFSASAGGVFNAESWSGEAIYDLSPPAPIFDAEQGPFYTNESPYSMRIDFEEPVVGFTSGMITSSGGVISGVLSEPESVDEAWTFNCTPSAEGNVTVNIAGGLVQDLLTFPNVAGSFWMVYDTTPPSATLSGLSAFYNTLPISVTLDLDDVVPGFASSHVTVTNGAVSGWAEVTELQYTFNIVPASNSTSITVAVPAGITTDRAGNLIVGDSNTFTYNILRPRPVFSTPQRSYNTGPTIPVTLTFSNDVTGVLESMITVVCGSCSIGSFATVDPSTYTFLITIGEENDYEVRFAPDQVNDLAGNPNGQAPVFFVEYDLSPPVLSFLTDFGSATNQSPFNVAMLFDEEVFGLATGSFTITGGSATAVTPTSSLERYILSVTPSGVGTIGISLDAGAVADVHGYTNALTGPFNVEYEFDPPVGALYYHNTNSTDVQPRRTKLNPFQLDLVMSELPASIVLGDFVTTNCVLSTLGVTGLTYVFTVTPLAEADVTVTLPAGAIADPAGNVNAEITYTITYDVTLPTVNITSPAGSATNILPVPVFLRFSEPVVLTPDKIRLDFGVTVQNFTVLAEDHYYFQFSPAKDGNARVFIGGVPDLASNMIVGTSWFVYYISSVPVASIVSDDPSRTPVNPSNFQVIFSKPTTGFEEADIVLDGGATISSFVDGGDGQTYSFVLTVPAEGVYNLFVPAGVATNVFDNSEATYKRIYDDSPPVVQILTPFGTNSNPIHFTIDFGELVTGFDFSSVTVVGGTPSVPTSSGARRWSFTVPVAAEGDEVTVSVAANAATDAQGYLNPAVSRTVIYDTIPPDVSLTSPELPGPSNAYPIPFTAVFSEAVPAFTASSVSVFGATVGNVTGGPVTFDFLVYPSSDGTVQVAILAFSVADPAGNGVSGTGIISIVSDTTPPAVTISSSLARTARNPIPISITFNEPCLGFAADVLELSGGTVDSFASTSATAFTFQLGSLAADGLYIITIPAAACANAAGSTLVEDAVFSVYYDTSGPVPTVSVDGGRINNLDPATVAVVFDESVTRFASSSLVLVNAVVGRTSSASNSSHFYIEISPVATGDVTIVIPAGVALDVLGHPSVASNEYTYRADITAPTLQIATPVSPTDSTRIPISFLFSEIVVGFNMSTDVHVSNAEIVEYVTDNTTGEVFDMIISPISKGGVFVGVGGGAAMDLGGNPNLPPTNLTLVYGIEVEEQASQSLLEKYGYTAGAIFGIFLLILGMVGSCIVAFLYWVDHEKKKRKKALAEEKLKSGGRALTIQEANEIYADEVDDDDDIFGVSIADVEMEKEVVVGDVKDDKKTLGMRRSSAVTKNLKRQKKELEYRRGSTTGEGAAQMRKNSIGSNLSSVDSKRGSAALPAGSGWQKEAGQGSGVSVVEESNISVDL